MKLFDAIARALAACMLLGFAGAAAAQAYPTKPVRIIVAYSPGGSTDTLARLLGQKLGDQWGQQVLVDNRPGASTIIGADAVAKSAPDGYTLFLMSVDHVIIPNLLPTPYDPVKDFATVGTVSAGGLALMLNPAVPANNLQEFIAYARSKPGELNYGSPASGGIQHLAGEVLSTLAGLRMQHIPYKGGGPVVLDLIGGQVQMYFTPPVTIVSHVKSGKLKAIAISGDARIPALPQVPTFAEAGLPAFDVKTWFAVAAPAGTPKDIVDKVSADIAKILPTPEMKDKIISLGMDPLVSTPEQFGAMLKAEFAKFAQIIKTSNIKLKQ